MIISKPIVVVAVLLILSAGAILAERSSDRDVRRLYSSNVQNRTEAAAHLYAEGQDAIPLLLPVICDQTKPNFNYAWPVAAKVLSDLRAGASAPCLTKLLMYSVPATQSPFRPDDTLERVDPAFAALTKIGEPAVPGIRRTLPSLELNQAYLALRALRAIGTPAAREAAQSYVPVLETQIRLTKEILEQFDNKPGK